MYKLLLALLLPAITFAAPLTWHPWSDDLFTRAAKENKLVLLDLEAVWCHWCHVMAETTYQDPAVTALLASKIIPVRVDQDSRPDLASRYRDWGWPATIIFNSKGEEIFKLAGYIEPKEMLKTLNDALANPVPRDASKQITYSDTTALPEALKQELANRFYSAFDPNLGGLRTSHRYLDPDSIEYGLFLAQRGDERAKDLTHRTLDGGLALIDPVWGGVYQYSTHYDWAHPHFEKIMPSQTRAITLYSAAFRLWGLQSHLNAARAVHGYLQQFLKDPGGGFYVSQDADVVRGEKATEYFKLGDKERRAIGIPAVDKHLYSRENGLVVAALAALYRASADRALINEAEQAASWVIKNRALPGGGFRHDESDVAGPFLADSLAMGQGCLELYAVTGTRSWLECARNAAQFIDKNFRSASDQAPSFISARATPGSILKPTVRIEENITAARFINLLFHYSGDKYFKELATYPMPYLTTKEVALDTITEPGILLVDYELSNDPTHITIVGAKDSPEALALFQAALAVPGTYKRTEWWDKREGPMPNPDVTYPELAKPAAFLCTNKRCSLPIFDPKKLAQVAETFGRKM